MTLPSGFRLAGSGGKLWVDTIQELHSVLTSGPNWNEGGELCSIISWSRLILPSQCTHDWHLQHDCQCWSWRGSGVECALSRYSWTEKWWHLQQQHMEERSLPGEALYISTHPVTGDFSYLWTYWTLHLRQLTLNLTPNFQQEKMWVVLVRNVLVLFSWKWARPCPIGWPWGGYLHFSSNTADSKLHDNTSQLCVHNFVADLVIACSTGFFIQALVCQSGVIL